MSKNTLVLSAIFFLIIVVILRFSSDAVLSQSDKFIGAVMKGQDVGEAAIGAVKDSAINPDTWSWGKTLEAINTWLHQFVDTVFPAFLSLIDVTTTSMVAVLGIESKVIMESEMMKPRFWRKA